MESSRQHLILVVLSFSTKLLNMLTVKSFVEASDQNLLNRTLASPIRCCCVKLVYSHQNTITWSALTLQHVHTKYVHKVCELN